MTRDQDLQKLQDDCGYIVIAHDERHPVGKVLFKAITGDGDLIPPVVVIGYTDLADFVSQIVSSGSRLTPEEIRAAVSVFRYEYFHKVVAE